MAIEMGGASLADSWWAVALRGVAALVFGVLALVMPVLTLATLIILLAAYLIADAVFAVIAGVRAMRHHQRWWSMLLEGLLDAVAAVVILLWPGLTALALVWVVAVWAIFTGVTALISAAILPLPHGRIWQLLSGIASIGLGIVMILLPVIGALTMVYWIALYAVLMGVFQLALSVRLYRRQHGLRRAQV